MSEKLKFAVVPKVDGGIFNITVYLSTGSRSLSMVLALFVNKITYSFASSIVLNIISSHLTSISAVTD